MTRFLVVAWAIFVIAGAANAEDLRLPDAERIVLANGSVLVLVEKHDVPLVGLQATLRGGAVTDPPGKHGLSNLVAGLLEKGAAERGAAEFAEAAAAVGGELDSGADIESINITANFMARDAALMVELVADMLQRPLLASDEFEKLKSRGVNLIKAAKGSNPSNLMPVYAHAFLFGGHPYGNPLTGSETSLDNIVYQDVRDYYEQHVGADRLVIAVAGDFETDTMRELLTEAFSDWRPAALPAPVIEAPDVAFGNRVLLIDKPGATQSYFYIGNLGVTRGYSGRASLNLANTVFGGRFTSMLMTELRTKSGLSYSASSTLSRYSSSGSTFINSYTETGTTARAIDVALETLQEFRNNGLDEEMLASSRNYIMGQFPPLFETASQLAGIFALIESASLDVNYINEYGAQLTAATTQSVAAAIDDVYPSTNNLVFVILGDAESIRETVSQYGPVTEMSISAPLYHPE